MKYLNTKPGSIEEIAANMSKHQNESGYQDMFKKELEKAGKGIGAMTPAEKKAFFNKIDDKYKAKNEDIKEGRYEVTGTVTYQGVSGEDEVTVVVDAMDKMDAEDVADDMIDDLRRKKKIGPKRGGQVKRFDPFDVEYTRKKEGLVDKMMEKVDEPYAVGMAQAMKSTGDKPPLKKSTITKAHDIAKSIEKDQKNEQVDQKSVDKFHTALDKLVHKTFGKSSDETKKEVKESVGQVQTRPDGKGNFNLIFRGKEIGYYHREGGKYVVYYDKEGDDYNQSDEVSTTSQAKKLAYDSMNEEAKYPHKMYSKDGKEVEAKTPEDHKKYADMGYTQKNETHTFMTKDMNKSKKDAKGEKEIVDPAPKMKFKEAYKKAKKEAMNTVGDATADQANQRVDEGPKENDPDIKKPKAKADTGSKATPVDTSPEVEYKN